MNMGIDNVWTLNFKPVRLRLAASRFLQLLEGTRYSSVSHLKQQISEPQTVDAPWLHGSQIRARLTGSCHPDKATLTALMSCATPHMTWWWWWLFVLANVCPFYSTPCFLPDSRVCCVTIPLLFEIIGFTLLSSPSKPDFHHRDSRTKCLLY